MTRRYEAKPIDDGALDRILRSAQKSPSAGFSQGFAFLVLKDKNAQIFWDITAPAHADDRNMPVIIIPLAHKQAYLDRYSRPDKAGTGMHVEAGWPVPYWTVDTAFASMIIMLSATAEGLGCWFFGIFQGKDELLTHFGVPHGYEPIGAIALGHKSTNEFKSPSLKRGLIPFDEVFHVDGWKLKQ